MGDGLKLAKDKRHRSSSSLAGAVLEGTRSERKLDLNVSIPEMEDQFALAESRCEDLKEKLDLLKALKKKRKLRKRSMTKVVDAPMTPDNPMPFITVRAQPKKKVSQQAARLRRLDAPPNPTRGYLDPATVEQHRMIGQMSTSSNQRSYPKVRRQLYSAEGDSIPRDSTAIEAATAQDEEGDDFNFKIYEDDSPEYSVISPKPQVEARPTKPTHRRRHVPKEPREGQINDALDQWRTNIVSDVNHNRHGVDRSYHSSATATQNSEERPVVELFCKNRNSSTDTRRQASPGLETVPVQEKKTKKVTVRNLQKIEQPDSNSLGNIASYGTKKEAPHSRRVKYRSRRYELPTVASQMKQAGMRYYSGTSNHTNIPFIVSKSTAPSHNIGVNIQQVLNGLKVQQPLSGIPLTIAHHMGLGHLPTHGQKSVTAPSLDNREINVIKVGQRLLRLPSYKFMSYNRLLSLYREGDGMVPRFLRAISRPHYFYTSMYNLATNRVDFDGATSKGQGGNQGAKQSLAEYASLYREYEHIDKCIRDGNYDPELERRKDELTRELAAREEYIRKVVQEYRPSVETEKSLRASASTADDVYRHPSCKVGEPPQ